MAQFNSDSHDGMSSLPTNSHGGMVMTHRCAVIFPVNATLVAGDKLVLGKLPAGYTVQAITADTDGITGLSVNVVQADSLIDAGATKTTLAPTVSLANAGGNVAGVMSKDAVRFKGLDKNLFLVAEVAVGGAVTKGQEVGVTVSYRYRQVAY